MAKTIDPNEELVEYTAPLKGGDGTQDVLVSVNGETLRIQRGIPVQIKRKFYKVLQQAARQEMAAYYTMRRAQEAAAKATAAM